MKRRQEGRTLQRGKGIGTQEDEAAGPVDHGSYQHTHQHGGLDALLGQQDDDKQTDEHGDDRQHHLAVLGTHVILDHAGGHGAEEVAHDIEGGGIAVALGVDSHVGAQADVHQHKADGGTDTQTDTQRDSGDDLITNVKNAQQKENDTLHQNDAQHRLEGAGVVGVQHGGHIAGDDGEEAVKSHTGRHDKGLVGEEGHDHGADGTGDAGGQEHTVPQGCAHGKVGQQVGVQGDDVGHRHECGETGQDLRFDGGAVLFQMKDTLHVIFSFVKCCTPSGASIILTLFNGKNKTFCQVF